MIVLQSARPVVFRLNGERFFDRQIMIFDVLTGIEVDHPELIELLALILGGGDIFRELLEAVPARLSAFLPGIDPLGDHRSAPTTDFSSACLAARSRRMASTSRPEPGARQPSSSSASFSRLPRRARSAL